MAHLATCPGPVGSDRNWTGAAEQSPLPASCVLGQETAPQFPQLSSVDKTVYLIRLL